MTELRSFSDGHSDDVETCAVVWWKGYVKGRFQAQLESDPPVVVAESPLVRWRGDLLPDPNDTLVSALAELAGSLRAAGWNVEGARMTRGTGWCSAGRQRHRRPARNRGRGRAALERELRESQAVTLLRSELGAARDAAERERQLRLEAEWQPRLGAERVPAVPLPAAKRRPDRIVVESASVVVAAAFFLLGFGSLYAAAVAALTTAAVCLGFDSYLATRPQRVASERRLARRATERAR